MSDCTVLAKYDAVGILDNAMDTYKKTVICDNCMKEITDGNVYVLCSTADQPRDGYHKSHNGCEDCAMNGRHISDMHGACKPCMALLNGRRSQLQFAGLALTPPLQNVMASKLCQNMRQVERDIEYARQEKDDARIQEGAERRAIAVEAVRERRKKNEKAIREQMEEEMQNETNRKLREAEDAAMQRELELHEQVSRYRKKAETSTTSAAEVQRQQEEAAEEAQRLREEAATAAQRLREEAAEEAQRLHAEAVEARQRALEEAQDQRRRQRRTAEIDAEEESPADGELRRMRQKRPYNKDPVKQAQGIEKRKVNKANKVAKEKADEQERQALKRDNAELKHENMVVLSKLDAVLDLAKQSIPPEDWVNFKRDVDHQMAQLELENAAGDEDYEEDYEAVDEF